LGAASQWRSELVAETRAAVKPGLITRAWARIALTPRVSQEALESFIAAIFMKPGPA
jgi:hypothetical protein